MTVPPALIKRGRSHFLSLPCQVDVIVGNNGYLFISTTPKQGTELDGGMKEEEDTPMTEMSAEDKALRKEERLRICRVRNTIQALADHFIAIYEQTIMETYEASLSYAPHTLLRPDIASTIVQSASNRTDHYQQVDE